MHENVLLKRLARAEERALQLEQLLEDKSRELFNSHEDLVEANHRLQKMYAAMPGALIAVHSDMLISEINASALQLLGYEAADLLGQPITVIWPEAVEQLTSFLLIEGDTMAVTHRIEDTWMRRNGEKVSMLVSTAVMSPERDMGAIGFICIGVDVGEMRKLEVQLRHAQKMESVGQLAAGIAHEINTPLQYLSDNVHFLQDAFEALCGMQPAVDALKDAALERDMRELAGALIAAEALADLPYLNEQVPLAIHRSKEGIDRVTAIVGAVKAFSRAQLEMAPFDLPTGILTTLEVARNEYKYVANVETRFGTLPLIMCNGGEIGQVILNLVVNAAHAISDKLRDTEQRGLIVISADLDGSFVEVRVSDNGGGIPENIRHRIFDPFFTTKEVGRGTGQGLTLVHSIIVDRHGGTVDFTTRMGEGTTFILRLPVLGKSKKESHA
jgi:PAS domain S-box-containing protein